MARTPEEQAAIDARKYRAWNDLKTGVGNAVRPAVEQFAGGLANPAVNVGTAVVPNLPKIDWRSPGDAYTPERTQQIVKDFRSGLPGPEAGKPTFADQRPQRAGALDAVMNQSPIPGPKTLTPNGLQPRGLNFAMQQPQPALYPGDALKTGPRVAPRNQPPGQPPAGPQAAQRPAPAQGLPGFGAQAAMSDYQARWAAENPDYAKTMAAGQQYSGALIKGQDGSSLYYAPDGSTTRYKPDGAAEKVGGPQHTPEQWQQKQEEAKEYDRQGIEDRRQQGIERRQSDMRRSELADAQARILAVAYDQSLDPEVKKAALSALGGVGQQYVGAGGQERQQRTQGQFGLQQEGQRGKSELARQLLTNQGQFDVQTLTNARELARLGAEREDKAAEQMGLTTYDPATGMPMGQVPTNKYVYGQKPKQPQQRASEKFVPGQVYADVQGRRARYKEDGTWEAIR